LILRKRFKNYNLDIWIRKIKEETAKIKGQNNNFQIRMIYQIIDLKELPHTKISIFAVYSKCCLNSSSKIFVGEYRRFQRYLMREKTKFFSYF